MRSSKCEAANCIEVAEVGPQVLIRDSRYPAGVILSVSREDWEAFAAGVAGGDFQLSER
jgi:hypothetical protein